MKLTINTPEEAQSAIEAIKNEFGLNTGVVFGPKEIYSTLDEEFEHGIAYPKDIYPTIVADVLGSEEWRTFDMNQDMTTVWMELGAIIRSRALAILKGGNSERLRIRARLEALKGHSVL